MSKIKAQTKVKRFSPKQTQNNPPIIETSTSPKDDSTTNVYTVLKPYRNVVSVRIRPELKEALKTYCKANGLSICHVFEGLVTGFLHGVNQQIKFVNNCPTMNVTVTREVKRARRYAVEEVEHVVERKVEIVQCDFCGKPGVVARFEHVNTGLVKSACGYHAKDLRARSDWLEVTV